MLSNLVTYCARAKLLSLIDEKFGCFLVSHPGGSFEIHFYDELPSGEWYQIEHSPKVFADPSTFRKLNSIDFHFDSQEFIISK